MSLQRAVDGLSRKRRSLPLVSRTPDRWAKSVLATPLLLLNDHAFLERKAALNAIELLHRWPERYRSGPWVRAMTRIAQEESAHLVSVVNLLLARGGQLSRSHKNRYASDLRKLVRRGEGDKELCDRLLVSALIELRSCERFEVLGRWAEDRPLARLYRGLGSSEFGHYKVFLKLAAEVRPQREVRSRWSELLLAEAGILALQPPGPRMHSGVPAREGGD